MFHARACRAGCHDRIKQCRSNVDAMPIQGWCGAYPGSSQGRSRVHPSPIQGLSSCETHVVGYMLVIYGYITIYNQHLRSRVDPTPDPGSGAIQAVLTSVQGLSKTDRRSRICPRLIQGRPRSDPVSFHGRSWSIQGRPRSDPGSIVRRPCLLLSANH